MRKLLSVFMAVLMMLSVVSISVFAEDLNPGSDIVEEVTDNPETPDEPEVPDDPTPTLDDYEYLVTMYICATANSFSGHVWLYFENLTECDVPIGYTTLAPHKGMSVGSLGNTRKDGGGTYYNGEIMMAMQNDGLDNVRDHTHTLKMNLTREQLEKVNSKITSMNFYELIFCNCGVFATRVWNSVSKKKVVHIVMPIFTILNMHLLGAKKGELRMQEADAAYKQVKNGCVIADNSSFNRSSV